MVKVYGYDQGLPTAWAWFAPGPKMSLLTKDRKGELWAIDLDSWSKRLVAAQPPGGLVNPDRRVLLEGVEGNLWIGTNGGGLYRTRKQAIMVYSQKEGLHERNIYPICEDRAGAIWIGAWPGSISRFKNGRITNYTRREGLATLITALYADQAGRLWVATGSGLQVLQGERFVTPRATEPLFKLVQVSVIYEDHEGALWFRGGAGLARYKDGISKFYSRTDGLKAGDIKVILEDAAGNLWIGGHGGLACFKAGRFKNYGEQDGLPSNTVRALYEDNQVWSGRHL